MNRLLHLWYRIFPLPTVKTQATEELASARLSLLESESQAEHWASQAEMLRVRIARLEGYAK